MEQRAGTSFRIIDVAVQLEPSGLWRVPELLLFCFYRELQRYLFKPSVPVYNQVISSSLCEPLYTQRCIHGNQCQRHTFYHLPRVYMSKGFGTRDRY